MVKAKRKTNLTRALESQVTAGAFWSSLASRRGDVLARRHTASTSLADLCELGRENDYRPSIPCNSTRDDKERDELKELADAYDRFQASRGDARRAYRC